MKNALFLAEMDCQWVRPGAHKGSSRAELENIILTWKTRQIAQSCSLLYVSCLGFMQLSHS